MQKKTLMMAVKGPKVRGTILVNSSTNFNLKLRHLSEN